LSPVSTGVSDRLHVVYQLGMLPSQLGQLSLASLRDH